MNKELVFNTKVTAPGIAIGAAFVFKPYSYELEQIAKITTESSREQSQLEEARLKVLRQLSHALKRNQLAHGDKFGAIFESQMAFLQDEILLDEILNEIDQKSCHAAIAVNRVLSRKSEHFLNLDNNFFRERAFDIIDLRQKWILALLGQGIDYHLNYPAIIVAENLSPSDTVNFNRNLLLGILTDQGGYTSHSAIFARGLNIPSMVNNTNLSQLIHNKDTIILDGENGKVIVHPTAETLARYKSLRKEYISLSRINPAEWPQSTHTADGHRIRLLLNIEFAHEASRVGEFSADGVGLFRTEALLFERDNIPDEQCQFSIYKKTLKNLKGAPCTIRTFDLGGDKLLKGVTEYSEPNPFLGWRAIRFSLDNPVIFKTQLKAMLKASVFGHIKILIPMINTIDEILHVKELYNEVRQELRLNKVRMADDIELGIMIETPAAAITAEALAAYVDFLSIGSNDLTQYTLAVDRTNNRIADRYNPFEPAVLKMIDLTINAARKNEKPLSVCGEFAADPRAIPLLLGMGVKQFSVAPANFYIVKKIIHSVNLTECGQLYHQAKDSYRVEEIETLCEQFLQNKMPDLHTIK
ncbi:MAG TPA: phosphoenolpyruvate--protein phosphotransferase [Caldithrix abyssi]|uniref:Phosphoenolpyruvate-protein phosphotransferase n=1 Tax=Caldithrix abyssi TaxID=187145 RepID=A0A7V1LNG1_CALAY|nr:phosphoenolpyruvate--protein phosphotransferase [Caldithrix abyssi]